MTRNRLNPVEFSNSQRKVPPVMNATSLSRTATMSYLRGSFLMIEPSPNQPPAGTPE